MNKDAVKERDDRLDGLERRLSSLCRYVRLSACIIRVSRTENANHLCEREEARRGRKGRESNTGGEQQSEDTTT